jgi:hypothetical protein
MPARVGYSMAVFSMFKFIKAFPYPTRLAACCAAVVSAVLFLY